MAIPAAEYLRTSHGEQVCSLDRQRLAIRRYADQHGYTIIRSYFDKGKSGVSLKGRARLAELLRDVCGGNQPYKAILVYSVDRWGRFQNVDESAHYEFLCRQAGVTVHYCAEPFSAEATIPNSVLKLVKRSMAAEYSRELGVKCFDGQKRLFDLGFHVGGTAGYGMQRIMVSKDGMRKFNLAKGEYKLLNDDRVLMVAGPIYEVDTVRLMFRLALRARSSPTHIARELNRRGIPYRERKLWNGAVVSKILQNPKYTGCNVWNRTSRRLGGRTVRNPMDIWLFRPGATPPIIDQRIFDRVQKCLRRRTDVMWSREAVLERVRGLLKRRHKLSAKLIQNDPDMPSLPTCYQRFGTLQKLYAILGYRPRPRLTASAKRHAQTLQVRTRLVSDLLRMFPSQLTLIRRPRCGLPHHLQTVDGRIIAVHVCTTSAASSGEDNCKVRCPANQRGFLNLVAVLCNDNKSIDRYYLFSDLFGAPPTCRFRLGDPLLKTKRVRIIRVDDLLQVINRL